MERPPHFHAGSLLLALAAGSALALCGVPIARADGAAKGASVGERFDLPVSRGVEPLTLDTPDAPQSIAHAPDPNAPTILVRARVIVRTADRGVIDALLAAR